jgi:O-antigen chain-terminating methyltransferase
MEKCIEGVIIMEIEIDDENVNVKEIMKQIRENINKREYPNDLTITLNEINNEQAINISLLEEYQLVLNRTWNNSAVTPIISNRKIVGGLIVFVKKVIRKVLGWYINPIVERQTEFNANVVKTYNELISQIKNMELQKMNFTIIDKTQNNDSVEKKGKHE